MSCRILVGHEQGSTREIACFFSSNDDWAFGPVFMDGETEAEEFMEFLGVDPRGFTQEQLEARYVDFRNHKRAEAEDAKKSAQAAEDARAERLLSIVRRIEGERMQCTCDLDNWQPERSTGHSWVCQIHRAAMMEIAAGKAVAQ